MSDEKPVVSRKYRPSGDVRVYSGVAASLKGLGDDCPNPINQPVVMLAMSEWADFVRARSEVSGFYPGSGYSGTNWLHESHGLGGGEDYDDTEPPPPTVQSVNDLLESIGGPASVIAYLYWAHSSTVGSVHAVTGMANHKLPYTIKRVDVDRWLSVISGAVLARYGSDLNRDSF